MSYIPNSLIHVLHQLWTTLYDVELCNQGVKNWSYDLKCIFEETDQMLMFNTQTQEFSLRRVLETTEKRSETENICHI